MTTQHMVLDHVRDQIKAKLDLRSVKATKLAQIASNAEKRGGNLTDAETRVFNQCREDIRELDATLDELQTRRADEEARLARKADLEQLARDIHPDELPQGQRQYRVGREEQTYRRDGQHSFFQDLIGEKHGNRDAAERLHRHHAETRDYGTTGLGDGLVQPQYLADLYAENLRAGRVTANLAHGLPLPPEGMTLTIPRGTTASVVSAQSGENTSVTEVDFDATDLVISVRTYAGQNDLSRQVIERGHGVDEIVYADLMADYNRSLDSDVINGAGTNGTHKGIRTATGTIPVSITTAGYAALYTAIARAGSAVASQRFLAPDVVVMHPRRWAWSIAQSDSNGRPMLDMESSPMNVIGRGSMPGEGFVGTIAGLPCYLDANIPTTVSTSTFSGATEDVVIVAKRDDLLLWEEPIRRFKFDDVGSATLTSRLQVVSASAFTAEHNPKGIAIISGSSLSTTLG